MSRHPILGRSALIAALVLFLCCVSAFGVTYNSQTQFSSTQGSNRWYYKYKTSTGVYYNMSWDAGNSRWYAPGHGNCLLGSNWAHPDNSCDAVRTWRAPSAGKVLIKGTVSDPAGGGGDGVLVRIMKTDANRQNTVLMWWAYIENADSTGYDYEVEMDVETYEYICVEVDERSNPAYDTTYNVFEIEHTVGGAVDSLIHGGASLTGTTSAGLYGTTYVFNYNSGERQYYINVASNNVQKGMIQVYEPVSQSYPIYFGGLRYRTTGGTVINPAQFSNLATVSLLSHSLSNGKLTLRYSETYEGITLYKTYTFELVGKTLVIKAFANGDRVTANGNYCGFFFDRGINTTNPERVEMPYYAPHAVTMCNNSYFYATTLDDTLSSTTNFASYTYPINSSSMHNSLYTLYSANTNGEIPPVNETGYLTVSNEVLDVINKPTKEASDYKDELDTRVMMDMWGQSFSLKRAKLQALYNYGVRHLVAIDHVWQKYGYDVGLPEHYPAGNIYGGHYAFWLEASTAASCGFLFGVHQNYGYMDSYEGKYWDEDDCVRDANGDLVEGWYQPETEYYTYYTTANKLLKYAQQEAPSIDTYGMSAAFQDGLGGHMYGLVDFNGANPNSRTMRQVAYYIRGLYTYMRDEFEGPVFSEGGTNFWKSDTQNAGYVDSVERELRWQLAPKDQIVYTDRENSPIMIDHELKHIKPVMANHGSGSHSRYFFNPYYYESVQSLDMMDKYRATSIAYGHGGYMDSYCYFSEDHYNMVHGLQEYYMMQALQAQYMGANVVGVMYWSGSTWMTLSNALKSHLSFKDAQIYVLYDSGLNIYINHHVSDNWQVTANGTNYLLPPNGWVAWNTSNGFLEYSALVQDTSATVNVYNAANDYSSTQGANNWYYLDWNGSSYSNMTYQYVYGMWVWKGSDDLSLLTKHLSHADTTTTSARKWQAPSAGVARIVGCVRDCDSGGDGVVASIYKNDVLLWEQEIVSDEVFGKYYDLSINVDTGDGIYFRVDAIGNNTCDAVVFNPTVVHSTHGGESFSFSGDYHSEQGYKGWTYLEKTGTSTYSEMDWRLWSEWSYPDPAFHYWKGAGTFPLFLRRLHHPGSNPVAACWTSPAAGTINIVGNAHDAQYDASGNGVVVYIYKNSTLLWSSTISEGDYDGADYDFTTSVSAGDKIYFVTSGNGNIEFDSTYFDPTISLTRSVSSTRYRRVDYVHCSEYTMANGRGVSTSFSGITAKRFKVIRGALTVTEDDDGELNTN